MSRRLFVVALVLQVLLMAALYGPGARTSVEPEVYSVYGNTGDIEVPVPLDAQGVAIPVPDRQGRDADIRVDVPVPEHATGIVGWHLSLFAKDRTARWLATVTPEVNGLGIDHLKGRETDPGQGPVAMLPSGLQIKLEGERSVSLHLKVFNEDDRLVKVRGNVWVFFAVAD